MGNQVAGRRRRVPVRFVAFLAPYAILAQPVHTTILTEIVARRGARRHRRVRRPRPVGARRHRHAGAAGVGRLPRARAAGDGGDRGRRQHADADLFAAALASLGVGLFFYCAFLLLRARLLRARRQPDARARCARVDAIIGAAVMVVGGLAFDGGPAKVAVLGLGHSVAYLLGSVVLFVVLRARVGHRFFPHAFLPALRGLGRARRGGLAGRAARSTRRAPRRRARARGDRPASVSASTSRCCACCRSGPRGAKPRSSRSIPISRSSCDPVAEPRPSRAWSGRSRSRSLLQLVAAPWPRTCAGTRRRGDSGCSSSRCRRRRGPTSSRPTTPHLKALFARVRRRRPRHPRRRPQELDRGRLRDARRRRTGVGGESARGAGVRAERALRGHHGRGGVPPAHRAHGRRRGSSISASTRSTARTPTVSTTRPSARSATP